MVIIKMTKTYLVLPLVLMHTPLGDCFNLPFNVPTNMNHLKAILKTCIATIENPLQIKGTTEGDGMFEVDWLKPVHPQSHAKNCYKEVHLWYGGDHNTGCCDGYTKLTKIPAKEDSPFRFFLCGENNKIYMQYINEAHANIPPYPHHLKNVPSCDSVWSLRQKEILAAAILCFVAGIGILACCCCMNRKRVKASVEENKSESDSDELSSVISRWPSRSSSNSSSDSENNSTYSNEY